MACSTFYSLTSSTMPSVCVTVLIICPHVLKAPNPLRAPLLRYALYNLKRIGDKQRPCLTSLPVFTFLVSPRSILTLKYDKSWGTV